MAGERDQVFSEKRRFDRCGSLRQNSDRFDDMAAHDPTPPSPCGAALFKRVALVVLAATAVGLFFAAQIYFSAASFRREVTWGQSLYWALGDWYEWALLLPAICWLSRTFRFDRLSCGKSLPVHLVGGLFLAAFHALLCTWAALLQGWFTGKPVDFGGTLHGLLANRLHYNLAVYAVIVCAWHAWDYHRKFREREAHASELAGRLAQAQLQALRMQLNPHFLCNTLNAVSSLMLKDVSAANKMICRLGDLLRIALQNTDQQEVTLQQEIDFLRRYLEIEQIRFGDRLELKLQVDPSTLDAAVPNFILQPLVENAIRHAVEPKETSGRIELRSVRDHGRLVLQIADNGSGEVIEKSATAKPAGDWRQQIGLSNTRERLRKLYGENQKLELTGNAMGGMTASFSIPFRIATVRPLAS